MRWAMLLTGSLVGLCVFAARRGLLQSDEHSDPDWVKEVATKRIVYLVNDDERSREIMRHTLAFLKAHAGDPSK